MSSSSKRKGLKVLVLSGNDLQAVASMAIIDRIMDGIQKELHAKEKPYPCDIFDMICGIGSGGWLALFLGRCHLPISSCFNHWQNTLWAAQHTSCISRLWRQNFRDRYVNTKDLLGHIKWITTWRPYLLDDWQGKFTCKHTFVAAPQAKNQSSYCIFRSYDVGAERDYLLPGALKPSEATIRDAFAATGAIRDITGKQVVDVDQLGPTVFLDQTESRHNMTKIALEEILNLKALKDRTIDCIISIDPCASKAKPISHTPNVRDRLRSVQSFFTKKLARHTYRTSMPQRRGETDAQATANAMQAEIDRVLTTQYKQADKPVLYQFRLDETPPNTDPANTSIGWSEVKQMAASYNVEHDMMVSCAISTLLRD